MTVNLGDNLQVSELGFGGMALTPVYGPADPAESLATLNHALDVGVSFIDTANVYGMGANEELISKLLKDRRDEVQLATKFGIASNPATGGREVRGDPAYVRESITDSLSRLNTDVIDLYYLHRLDSRVPIEETVGAMAELVAEGKVRHLGLSEVTAAELERAHGVHPIAAVQSEWSIWSRDVEQQVVPAAARLGVGFVPYAPLGRGFLTGTLQVSGLSDSDFRRQIPRFEDTAATANQAVVDSIAQVAGDVVVAGRPASPAQIALAWLFNQGKKFGLPVVPIPGTRRAARIDENLAAASIQLTESQLATLDQAADAVVGRRSDSPNWVSEDRE